MDATGPTLPRRALAVLQAKQYLVFYAIPVYALAALVPLLLSWMRDRGTVEDVLGRPSAPLYDAAAPPGPIAAGVLVAYLGAYTWFRAGYIRSIIGRYRLRPQSGAQFFSLLGVYVITEVVAALGGWSLAAGGGSGVGSLAVLALLTIGVILMYSDYAAVITGLDPVRSVARSWACVRANLALSALIALVVYLIGSLAGTALFAIAQDGWWRAAPLLVIYVVVMGVVTFVADVVMIVVYLHSVETGRLPRAR